MPKRILFYGDSNTYGYDPRGFATPDNAEDDRYRAADRWPDRLAANPAFTVLADGMNGRMIPHTPAAQAAACRLLWDSAPLDTVAVMLGTNDLFGPDVPSATAIAGRMEAFLRSLPTGPALLLIAPPPVQLAGGGAERRLNAVSQALPGAYRTLAASRNIAFADAGAWGIPLAFDGIHFSAPGHWLFAEKLREALYTMFAF